MTFDPSIIAAMNTAADVPSAVNILRSSPNYIADPNVIADYLAAPNSKFAAGLSGSSSGASGSSGSGGSGSSIGIMGIMGMAGGGASLMGMMKLGGNATSQIGTGVLAAIMQYEVFSRAEAAAARAVTATIALLGAVFIGALFATMLWLSTLNPGRYGYDYSHMDPFQALIDIIKHGNFGFDPCRFWHTFAVAGLITAAVLAMGIIAGMPGSKGAPTTSMGQAISNALSQIPAWYNSLPSAAVAMISAGLTIGGTAHSLSPGNIFQQFSVPTYEISQAATAAGSPGARIFVQPAQGAGTYDTVYIVSPGANGESTVSAFQVDSNGYLVGPNGPDQSYLPFETPTVGGNGSPTGYTINQGAFNALYQIPACTAIANDTSLDANSREAALETCLRNNKNVQFVPM